MPTARPPAATRVLASYAPLVHEIAITVVAQPSPPYRGIAQLELFLNDSDSALYHGDADALGVQLQTIAAALKDLA